MKNSSRPYSPTRISPPNQTSGTALRPGSSPSGQSRNQLQHSLYHALLDQTRIEFPEDFLKRWMKTGGEKPKSQAEVEQEFPSFDSQLKCTLILDKVIHDNGIDVTQDEIKGFGWQQLLGYMGGQFSFLGGGEMPWIADYV